jgi:hypothetical protein
VRTDGIGTQRPHDLHVVGLIESGEAFRWNTPEDDVGFPGSRDRAHHDFAPGNIGEHDPAQLLCDRDKTAGPILRVRFGAKQQLPALEDGSNEK